jgi:hypothetical protein
MPPSKFPSTSKWHQCRIVSPQTIQRDFKKSCLANAKLGSLGHSNQAIDFLAYTIYYRHQFHHDDHGAQASTIQLSSMIYDAKAMVSSCQTTTQLQLRRML